VGYGGRSTHFLFFLKFRRTTKKPENASVHVPLDCECQLRMIHTFWQRGKTEKNEGASAIWQTLEVFIYFLYRCVVRCFGFYYYFSGGESVKKTLRASLRVPKSSSYQVRIFGREMCY
jgi:hypothetical protein